MRRTVEGLLVLARQECAVSIGSGSTLEDIVGELLGDAEERAQLQVIVRVKVDGVPLGPAELWAVVLRNLLENSLAATTTRAIDVTVSRLGVMVCDTGPGMEMALIKHVTEDSVGGSSSQGIGLGLAIVGRLAKRLGAEVDVSSPAGGTAVELQIPATASAMVSKVPPETRAGPSAEPM